MKKIILFFFLLLFNIILNNNETKNLNDNQSSSLNDQYFSSSSEDIYNSNTFITLLIVLISLILLVVILFIFYKFYLNSYIERNKIPNFKTTNKYELKKHFLFQKLMKWKYYKNNDEEEVCPICLQKFNKNFSKICITPCNHIFHFYCLKKYMLDGKGNKCPNCNFNFLEVFKTIEINPSTVEIIPIDEKDNPINYTEEVLNKDSTKDNKNSNDVSNNVQNNKNEVVNLTQPSIIVVNSKSILDKNNSKDILKNNLNTKNQNIKKL